MASVTYEHLIEPMTPILQDMAKAELENRAKTRRIEAVCKSCISCPCSYIYYTCCYTCCNKEKRTYLSEDVKSDGEAIEIIRNRHFHPNVAVEYGMVMCCEPPNRVPLVRATYQWLLPSENAAWVAAQRPIREDMAH